MSPRAALNLILIIPLVAGACGSTGNPGEAGPPARESRYLEPPAAHVIDTGSGFLPAAGYDWVDEHAEGDLSVRWAPGSPHPEWPNIRAGPAEGNWRPAPGYEWVAPESLVNLAVRWAPGRAHADHVNVVAAEEEGSFYPAPGYEWAPEGTGVRPVRWAPEKPHPWFQNVLASDRPDTWRPAEGYEWVSPDENDLRVQPRGASAPPPAPRRLEGRTID